ncbi:CRTAC1 family protein [Balneolaceae bacterium YR4-1]|uniref:CRTAC1 family protein n=1 Tax=Halalkalibaculum roseum TaxID=2709311 RepID=A0A6M1SXM3_9BACT|nr:CRTAC1 family protein [Halalkalibaculum roseum]
MLTGLLVLLYSVILPGCQNQHELKWEQGDNYRRAELPEFNSQNVGFSALSARETNIDFINTLPEDDIVENRHLLNGSGVAAGDIDDDGFVDLYFTHLNGANELFRNTGGMQFENITETAGVALDDYYSTGATFSDVTGDGKLDLLVTTNNSGTFLYENDGNGNFSLIKDSGLNSNSGKGGTTLTLADIDGDSDLDLYVTNYKQQSVRDIYNPRDLQWNRIVKRSNGKYVIKPPYDKHYTVIEQRGVVGRYEYGESDELYINRGDGKFKQVTRADSVFFDTDGKPVSLPKDWGLTAKFYDINDDGFQDLYVCNDFWTPDRIWINRGDGSFKAIDKLAIRSLSASSMGVAFSDIDRDGHTDFFTTDMLSTRHSSRMRQIATEEPVPPEIGAIDNRPLYMRNMLFHNRGDNTFEEIAQYSGVAASEWSWATNFMDIDLDGYEDIFVTTGNAYDVQDADVAARISQGNFRNWKEAQETILTYPTLKLKNRFFKNDGDLTFTDKTDDWGIDSRDISNGAATADLDNDGDLDIILNRLNEDAVIYRNDVSKPRIAIRLVGNNQNFQAIGARVMLQNGDKIQQKEISSGGGYLSGSDPLTVFSTDLNESYNLTIKWPDGRKSSYKDIRANHIYEIAKPTDTDSIKSNVSESDSTFFFKEESDRVNYKHHEESYQDFKLQPLLPYKLSRLGPGVSWIDYNSDGIENLFVSSGKGGVTGIFEDDGTTFSEEELDPLTDPATGDQTTILGWKQNNKVHLIVGSANFEQGRTDAPSAYHYILNNGKVIDQESIPGVLSTTGPLAMADYTGDGFLDLFVGGTFNPGQYPISASSRLFINQKGKFKPDTNNTGLLKNIGLVKSATFSDYDKDGDPDLILATEWGPIKIFENNEGAFAERSSHLGIEEYTGLWNGVTTGDINNDGLPDIIATNRGLNSGYQLKGDSPLYIYYGDSDRDGRLEMYEAYKSEELGEIVPLYNMNKVSTSDEALNRKVSSHAAYGEASLSQIIGADLERVPNKDAATLAHMLFINTGNGFRTQQLPSKAQFSTAHYAGIADFDGDGNEDIFLSQNLFAVPAQSSRSDAGRGLWLKGDGNANFTAVDGHKTGIKVYGEQRGAALGDYNDDGRIDLAVSQNGTELKLYKNISGKKTLSVELLGPASNAWAIGSGARLVFPKGRKGPYKEIQAGSGYWSQNSRLLLFGYNEEPVSIEINWFDGTRQRIKLEELPEDLQLQVEYSNTPKK